MELVAALAQDPVDVLLLVAAATALLVGALVMPARLLFLLPLETEAALARFCGLRRAAGNVAAIGVGLLLLRIALEAGALDPEVFSGRPAWARPINGFFLLPIFILPLAALRWVPVRLRPNLKPRLEREQRRSRLHVAFGPPRGDGPERGAVSEVVEPGAGALSGAEGSSAGRLSDAG